MFEFIKTTVVCERYGDADWCELHQDSQFKAVAQNKNENEYSTICTQIQMAFGVLYSVYKITQNAHIVRMLHRAEYRQNNTTTYVRNSLPNAMLLVPLDRFSVVTNR